MIRPLSRVLALVLAVVLACAGCGAAAGGCSGTAACTRVLFIGNSYTYVNDLPATFAALARAGDHPVDVTMVAEGGATLAQHAADPALLERISTGSWDVVVLQEQSQVPASAQALDTGMVPAARTLAHAISGAGARPMLFLTWAHRDGWPEAGLPGYTAMQARITAGYLAVSRDLGAAVAPVGIAWEAALKTTPGIVLWQADGSHPTTAGTYLAACVFYAAIFDQSPEGLGERSGLSDGDAAALQAIAATTTLADPGRWNLP